MWKVAVERPFCHFVLELVWVVVKRHLTTTTMERMVHGL
jgi:hypothetical protein